MHRWHTEEFEDFGTLAIVTLVRCVPDWPPATQAPYHFLDIALLDSVIGCTFRNCTVVGTLDGGSTIEDANIGSLSFVNGIIRSCLIDGPITLGGSTEAHFLDCASGVPGSATPILDAGGNGPPFTFRNYSGGIEIRNKTGADSASLDFNSGQVVFDSTVSNGTVVVRGIAQVTDNSTGSAVIDTANTISPALIGPGIATAVWAKSAATVAAPGSIGLTLKDQLSELWTLLGLNTADKITITPGGIDSDSGTIDINFTGDGVNITVMERQP